MRCLVTGAAGFIGGHICRALVSEGHDVVGLDDLSGGRLDVLAEVHDIRFEHADVRDSGAVVRAARGCAVILHQAAAKSVTRSLREPRRFDEINVRGTLNVLEAARDVGARVVFASSSSVYGDQEHLPVTEEMEPRPRSPYAATKLAGEAYCRAWWLSFAVPTIALRYFNVYGPAQDPASEYAAVIPRFVVACLTRTRPKIYGDGDQARDFTYVDDVVDANLRSIVAPEAAFGRVLNIAGGQPPTSVNHLLQRIAALAGVVADPIREAPRPGDIRRSHADIAAAGSTIGYEPRVDMEQGLRKTIAWFSTIVPR